MRHIEKSFIANGTAIIKSQFKIYEKVVATILVKSFNKLFVSGRVFVSGSKDLFIAFSEIMYGFDCIIVPFKRVNLFSERVALLICHINR